MKIVQRYDCVTGVGGVKRSTKGSVNRYGNERAPHLVHALKVREPVD